MDTLSSLGTTDLKSMIDYCDQISHEYLDAANKNLRNTDELRREYDEHVELSEKFVNYMNVLEVEMQRRIELVCVNE